MKILLDENGIQRSITRISYEIIERNKSVEDIVLVGIKSRGDILAERIKQKVLEIENIAIPLETIDITYYRDDIDRKNFDLDIKKTEFKSDLTIRADFIGKNIPTSHSENIEVYLKELDGKEEVVIL